jgi:hypothetical protein
MGGGGSSSSSENTTSSVTEDNKVAAQDNAVALGNEAVLNYTDQFSPEVAGAFRQLVDLASASLEGAKDFAQKSLSANQSALDSVASTAQKAQDIANLKDSVIFQKFLPYIGVGAVLLILLTGLKKGGK